MALPLPPATGSQQRPGRHGLSQHYQFDKPACPIDCDACKSWSCIGQRRLHNHDSAFTAIIGIGTLGGGFTFTVIFSTIDNRNGAMSQDTIDHSRHLLIVAWVLFILAVTGASVLAFHHREQALFLVELFDQLEPKVSILDSALLGCLQLLILAAFYMSARALKPYDHSTAQAATILILVAGSVLILMVLSSIQAVVRQAYGWRKEVSDWRSAHIRKINLFGPA